MSGPGPIKRSNSYSASRRLSVSGSFRRLLSHRSQSVSSSRTEELKDCILGLMFDESDEEKPVVISNEKSKFQLFLIKVFNQLDDKQESCGIDALNTILNKHLPRCFSDDLLMYMLLAHKLIQLNGFRRYEEQKEFVLKCMENFEAMETEQVAIVTNNFVERGDFFANLKNVFSLLRDASLGLLSLLQSWSDESGIHRQHSSQGHPHVYSRFMWISMALKFDKDKSLSVAQSLWDENILRYCSEMILDSRLINEIGKGLRLGSQLRLPMKHTFNYLHMADFLVKAKTMRSLVAIEYYFQIIEAYINNNAQLMDFLTLLREKYEVILNRNTTDTIATMSIEGTLCGMISEGIHLTDCIHTVCTRHSVEPAIIELECIKWLMMFIGAIDLTNNLAKIQLGEFLSSEPAILQKEACHKAIIEYIHDGTLNSLPHMTVEQFGSLFSTLGDYYSTLSSIVEGFLKEYVFPPNFRINDPSWIIFLNKVVSKCKGAKNHSFLILNLFEPATDHYAADGNDKEYLSDLLEVSHKVSGLLAIENGLEEGEKHECNVVSLKFKEFLRSIVGKDTVMDVILTQNTYIMSDSAADEDSESERLLFDVLCEYILKCDIYENLPSILRSATVTLCRDMSWIQSTTLKQKFCLKCMVACCDRITPPGTSNALQWVQTYSDIITELGRTYNKYCHQNGLTNKNGHLTCPGQQQLYTDLLNGSIEDARRYFVWVQDVQYILEELNDRLIHQEVKVHDITNTKDDDDKYLECLSVIMCIPSLVSVKKMEQKCSSFLEELNKVLLKTIPGQHHSNFKILPELLSKYHMVLPQNLQELVSKYVIYPDNNYSLPRDSKCLSHLQADCKSQPDNKPFVELSESITMSELAVLVDELDKFHEPIEKFIAMLTFFEFHNSVLFRKCFNAQIFDPTIEIQSHHIRDTKIPPQHKENEMNLSSFVLYLENTHKVILKFLNGQCHYTDIAQLDPEAHLEITKELDILQQYSAVFKLSSNGLMDTCNMFNFHKFTCQVNSIIFVCRQFRLEECLKDSRLCELQTEVLELQNEAVRSKLTSTDISRKVKHMKELLGIADDTNLLCLDLFSVIKAHCSNALVQVMTDEQCRLRHKDVAKHLQHEASAIKDFSSVVELMNPFLDADQKFESLMSQVFKKGNMEQGIQTLKSIDAQLPFITEVFSSESPVLCREEKQSAIQAKEENIRLHEKLAQYEYQLKQFAEEKTKLQERIDYLEKENKALLRKKKELHQETVDLRKFTSEVTIENRVLKEDNQSHQAEIQVLSEVKESLQQENSLLQKERDSLRSKNTELCLAQQESIAFGIEPWKVSRDKIKLDRVIGGGGWGAVLEGDLKVAIKQFYPSILSKQNMARLKREMKMLARIRHPNLVQFIAVVFEENDNVHESPPYIITELLDVSLREAYENDQVSEGSMYPIFQDTARALDYLHRRHEPIIHRDVSSANVLLKCLPNEMWMAKVSDLGSANLAKDAFTKNEGARIYCAPEAFTETSDTHSEEVLTSKVDVYSYGIMLCEVVTRKLPETEKFQNLLQQAECKKPRLYPLILQCISQEPNKRPSMANVLTTLETLSL